MEVVLPHLAQKLPATGLAQSAQIAIGGVVIEGGTVEIYHQGIEI